MKLTIRFADQIVGGLIILALGIIIFVIFMLGSNQRWFSRDYRYKTYFNSAAGLSQNMPVQYKGFTIGHVKSFDLSEDDRVEVYFTIFDTYVDRVREGSLVEVLVSPIGMGNQFMFYPGLGTEYLSEGETVPAVNSTEGKLMIASGLAIRPERDDSINNIMNQASSALATLNNTLLEIQDGLAGNDRTDLGRILHDLRLTADKLPGIAETVPNELLDILDSVRDQLEPVLVNLNAFSAALADPNGTAMAVLGPDGTGYKDLTASLDSISGILRNLERTSEFIPTQLPQVAAVLSELYGSLKTAQDVLVSLTNNPLLKRGIPEHKETRAGGVRPRDLEF
jgi:phospholipid/cholesterol/gamma-HCH transport system substrate-binding protein